MQAKKTTGRMIGGGILLLFALCGLSACIGSYPLSLPDILRVITGNAAGEMGERVFFTLRLPRVLTGAAAGASLGLCGGVFQLLFRNPLASPDLVGVASGAGAGAACAIVLGTGSMELVTGGAFLGGMAALLGVFLLVWHSGGNRPGSFILGGILISSLADAAIMLLKHGADSEGKLAAIEFWTMGSLSAVTASKAACVCALCLPCLLLLILFHREIVLLGLGDEQASILGLSAGKMRLLLLTLATLAVAGVIAATGVIAFVGLLAPHGAYLLLRRKNRAYLWMSMLTGAILTVAADCFARSVTDGELPLSIFTTLCAAPFLFHFLRTAGGKEL